MSVYMKYMNNQILNVIGFLAGLCSTLASVPQVYKAARSGSTKDLSYPFLILVLVGNALWIVFGALSRVTMIVFWTSISCVMYLTLLFIKVRHDRSKTVENEVLLVK